MGVSYVLSFHYILYCAHAILVHILCSSDNSVFNKRRSLVGPITKPKRHGCACPAILSPWKNCRHVAHALLALIHFWTGFFFNEANYSFLSLSSISYPSSFAGVFLLRLGLTNAATFTILFRPSFSGGLGGFLEAPCFRLGNKFRSLLNSMFVTTSAS